MPEQQKSDGITWGGIARGVGKVLVVGSAIVGAAILVGWGAGVFNWADVQGYLGKVAAATGIGEVFTNLTNWLGGVPQAVSTATADVGSLADKAVKAVGDLAEQAKGSNLATAAGSALDSVKKLAESSYTWKGIAAGVGAGAAVGYAARYGHEKKGIKDIIAEREAQRDQFGSAVERELQRRQAAAMMTPILGQG